jgi:hypothetical protein
LVLFEKLIWKSWQRSLMCAQPRKRSGPAATTLR